MAGRLALKIDRQGDATAIAWRDALSNRRFWFWLAQSGSLLAFGMALLVLFVLDDVWTAGGIALLLMFFGPLTVMAVTGILGWIFKFRYRRRRLVIAPGELRVGRRRYNRSAISRVEYGSRGQWDRSKPELAGRTQIRIWFDDLDYLVVAENDWTAAVNHKIQQVISRELQRAAAPAFAGPAVTWQRPEPAPSPQPQTTGRFGMPDA